MNKKFYAFIPVILLVLVFIGCVIFNNSASQHQKAASDFLKEYYSADDYKILDEIKTVTDIERLNAISESLYQEKYRETLTKEAYERLAANRDIFEPEEIVKDFGCTLEFENAEIKKHAETVKGNPVYSYNARIKATLPNNEIKEFIETGTIELVRDEDNKWKVSRLNIANRRNLYKSIEEIISDS